MLAELTDTIGVQRLLIFATGVMLASVIAFAQPNGRGPGPVLGIVEIPEMFLVDPNTGRYTPRAALTLYTRPDSESKVAAVISSPEAIDEAEYRLRGKGSARLRSRAWLFPDSDGARCRLAFTTQCRIFPSVRDADHGEQPLVSHGRVGRTRERVTRERQSHPRAGAAALRERTRACQRTSDRRRQALA